MEHVKSEPFTSDEENTDSEREIAPLTSLKQISSTNNYVKKRMINYIDMILDAINTINEKKGISARSIEKFIQNNYNTTNSEKRFKTHLKLILLKALRDEILFKKNGAGLIGLFKIHPNYIKTNASNKKMKNKNKTQKLKEIKTVKTKITEKKKAKKTVRKSLLKDTVQEKIDEIKKTTGKKAKLAKKVEPNKQDAPAELKKSAKTGKSAKSAAKPTKEAAPAKLNKSAKPGKSAKSAAKPTKEAAPAKLKKSAKPADAIIQDGPSKPAESSKLTAKDIRLKAMPKISQKETKTHSKK